MSSLQGQPGGDSRPDSARRASSREAVQPSVAAGTKALLVEDDHNSRFALAVLLKGAGITVFAATNGEAALQTLEHRPGINLVLMDIMMPVMDGYATMTAIRKLPGFKDLPIIAVTAKPAEGERQRCLAAGASDYIPKPVNAAELLGAIARWRPAEPEAQT